MGKILVPLKLDSRESDLVLMVMVRVKVGVGSCRHIFVFAPKTTDAKENNKNVHFFNHSYFLS